MEQKKKIFIAAGALLVIIIGAILIGTYEKDVPLPFERDGDVAFDSFEVSAETFNQYGVDSKSGFKITTKDDYSVKQMKKMITTNPNLRYKIKKLGAYEYLFTPKGELPRGEMFQIILNGHDTTAQRSFTFNIVGDFEAKGIFPADLSEGVPINSTIELKFTYQPEQNLQDYFEITPAVEGQFEYEDSTAIFTHKGLSLATTYQVKVKAGFKGVDGVSLKKDQLFTFTTETENSSEQNSDLFYLYGNAYETVLTTDTPILALGVYSPTYYAEKQFTLDVYRLQSMEEYLGLIHASRTGTPGKGYNNDVKYDTKDKEIFTSFTTELVSEEKTWGQGFLPFVDPLPEGYYVVQASTKSPVTGEMKSVQKLFQIADVAAYHQSSNGENTVWLNSAKTGQPMAGVTVDFYTNPNADRPDFSKTTDKDGIATVQTNTLKDEFGYQQSTQYYYVVNDPNGQQFTEILWCSDRRELSMREKYYGYLYTDREIYHPTDNVQFWGILRSRRAEAEPFSKVSISLVHTWEGNSIYNVDVTVNKDGTFKGEIPFEYLTSGYYTIYMKPYGAKEDSGSPYLKSFKVNNFEKPTYVFESSTAKEFYTLEEQFDTTMDVTLFDGTPAPNVEVGATVGGIEKGTATTDVNGRVEKTYKAKDFVDDSYHSWQPIGMTYEFSNYSAEQTAFVTSGNVNIFPSDMMMQVKKENRGENAYAIQVRTNALDLSKLKNIGEFYRSEDIVKGKAIEKDLTIKMFKVYYERKALTPYYDRVMKRSVERFEYNRIDTEIKNTTVSTKNGFYEFTDFPIPEKDERTYYYVVISTKDGKGRIIEETIMLGRDLGKSDYETPRGKFHTFQIENSVANSSQEQDAAYDGYSYTQYTMGEKLTVRLKENGTVIEPRGNVFYSIVQDKVLQKNVTDDPYYNFVTTEQMLPNFMVSGAYFDGKHIYPVRSQDCTFAPESRELQLTIQTGKDKYKPGETASVNVQVTDKKGNPVAANVCLGVVDEAVFAIEEQSLQFAQTLYQSVYYYYPNLYATYIQHGSGFYYDEGGKGGGGGGEATTIRSDFRDTVDVYTVYTDKNGKANVAVKLPDNLTSWRLTALAFSGGMQVGTQTSNLYSTLPFYVQPILNERYMEGDEIAFTTRVFGTDMKLKQPVKYTAVITGDNVNEKAEKSGVTGEYTTLSLKSLPAGSYTVTLTAASGTYTDTIRKTFTVSRSVLEVPVTKTVNIAEGVTVQAERYPAEILMYNKEYQSYMNATAYLLGSYGNRADQLLGSYIAKASYKKYFAQDILSLDLSKALKALQNIQKEETGGLRLFQYSGEDIELTAKALLVAPDLIDRWRARGYLREQWYRIKNPADYGDSISTITPDEKAAMFMGLAAMEEEDIISPMSQMLRANSTTLKQKLYLISGLYQAGSTKEAAAAYQSTVTPLVQKRGDSLYLKGANERESQELTALAMMAAIELGHSDVEGMLHFLCEERADKDRTNVDLEVAYFIKKFTPKNAATATVTYQLDGKPITVQLKGGKMALVTMNKKQLEEADFKVTAGEAFADVRYMSAAGDLSSIASPNIQINKKIDIPPSSAKLGGISTITIQVQFGDNAPEGHYTISEWIPSNMRLKNVQNNLNHQWWYKEDGQQLTFELEYNKALMGKEFTVTYTTTNVLQAQSVVDSTFIFHSDTMEGAKTPKSTVKPFN